jgi:hypothetical protein
MWLEAKLTQVLIQGNGLRLSSPHDALAWFELLILLRHLFTTQRVVLSLRQWLIGLVGVLGATMSYVHDGLTLGGFWWLDVLEPPAEPTLGTCSSLLLEAHVIYQRATVQALVEGLVVRL